MLLKEDGNVISKAPRNEIPKTKNIANTKTLNHALLAILFKAEGPNIVVIRNPISVNTKMIEPE